MKTALYVAGALMVTLVLSGGPALAGSMMNQETGVGAGMDTGLMEKDRAMNTKADMTEDAKTSKDGKMTDDSGTIMGKGTMPKDSMMEEKDRDGKEGME